MKKILLLAVITSFAFASPSFAQKGKAKKWKKQKTERNERWEKDDDRWDRNEDRRYDRNQRNDRRYNKKYANNNAPRKVRDAFYSDFPNAKDVRWTKQRGVWTATFRNGIFNSNRTVSYAANGRRVDRNDVFANNNRRQSNIFNY